MPNPQRSSFSEQGFEAIYPVIHGGRDVRSEFIAKAIPDDIVGRILDMAHHAPSVGFMQPWDFILIESPDIRRQILSHFQQMKERGDTYESDRQALYRSLKLEGILDSPLNVCITCDLGRSKGTVSAASLIP